MTEINYNFSEISYKSADGKHVIYAELYTPKNKTAKGIVQLAHGMRDYVGRYKELANYLCGEGYIFAGNCHLGHGKSAGNEQDFGYFAEKDGVLCVLRDMHTMNRYLRDTFPTLPLVLFGHSMGSFLARLYILRHPHSIKGAVIHGTSGPNPLVGMGKLTARIIRAAKGGRHRSGLLTKLAFGSYNKKFPKSEGENAWLTRDTSAVADRIGNEYTSFIFTTQGYLDLFSMIGECNSREWFKSYPKELPTLIMSGNDDPVGNYGKGPSTVYKKLLISGVEKVTKLTYDGARHELFNETNRQEVFADLVNWLGGICK